MINWCESCAYRLFNTKVHHIEGIGNPWNGKCIVLPNVDYSAYKHKSMSFSEQVGVLDEVLYSSTGELLLNFYVVPMIRCNELISPDIDKDTYNRCLHWFAEDIKKYDFKDILLCGSAGRRFLSTDISKYLNTLFVTNNNRRYSVNYSPLIKLSNSLKYNEFKENLFKWHNAVLEQDFCRYEMMKL